MLYTMSSRFLRSEGERGFQKFQRLLVCALAFPDLIFSGIFIPEHSPFISMCTLPCLSPAFHRQWIRAPARVVWHFPCGRPTAIFVRPAVSVRKRSSQLGFLMAGDEGESKEGLWALIWVSSHTSQSIVPKSAILAYDIEVSGRG